MCPALGHFAVSAAGSLAQMTGLNSFAVKFRTRRLSGILAAYSHLTENSAEWMLAKGVGFHGARSAGGELGRSRPVHNHT